MARTDSQWLKTIGGYLKTAAGLNILINGENRYLNFNLVSGSTGYGIRDNGGTIEFKDSGGSWVALAGGASGITTEQAVDAVAAAIASGTHSGITITYNDAGDAISFEVTGGGGGLTQEEVEDYIGGLLSGGTGITATYDDAGNILTISLSDEQYTTAEKSKVANVPADTNTALAGKSDTGHTHDDRYYTESETDTLLAAKADTSSLATVATSGDYDDLSNKPDLSLYDNIEVAADSGSFPATGSSDVLYLETNTGLLYRWNGSSYSVVSGQLALGETSSTAYRGDRGKTAYDHSQLTSGNPHSVTKSDVGLSNVPNTDATARANHTGTQTAATISDFDAEAADAAETALAADAAKTTPVDADKFSVFDSAASFAHKLVTWANIKATIKAYYDPVASTLTNKRVQPRVSSTTSTATLTPEIASYDLFVLTAQAAPLTIANHSSSTPSDGEMIRIRITDDSTARAISFGTNYVAKGGIGLPTTTTVDKRLEMGFEWDAALSKYVLVALAEEA